MDEKISSLTETQYSQLCEEARHYTHQTWLAPSTALTFIGASLAFSATTESQVTRLAALAGAFLITIAYTHILAKHSAYRRMVVMALRELEEKHPQLVVVNRSPSTLERQRLTWIEKTLTHGSAASFMCWIMLVLTGGIGCLIVWSIMHPG